MSQHIPISDIQALFPDKPIVYIKSFPVMYSGWECDDVAYLVSLDKCLRGECYVVMTNHGTPHIATLEEMQSKLSEYEKASFELELAMYGVDSKALTPDGHSFCRILQLLEAFPAERLKELDKKWGGFVNDGTVLMGAVTLIREFLGILSGNQKEDQDGKS